MKVIPWVLLGIVLALWWREATSTNAALASLRHTNDSLVAIGRGKDTLYVRQTDTLHLVRVRTDSLLRTDTIIHTDTVRQIVERERRACDALLQTCEEQKANLRSQIENLHDQIKTMKPSRFGCTAGPSLNTKGFGLGATCGVRF